MKKFLLVCFSFYFVLSAWAQDRVITGRVTSEEDGSGLPGVNVIVKGTGNGTVTDMEGNFSLSVSEGSILVVSFVGFKTVEVAIGSKSVVNVSLQSDVQQLTEVVVTAQGIAREQKSLGYAQTTVSSELLANKPETDVGRALQGRTPGLQILNSSGIAGSGSRVNIRGNSSITGDTQPLWVVDGVPINTSSNDVNASFEDGQVSPSRFLDIDPNNIESISILRGLNATTLYGSQGRNGVILVSTKTGSQKKNVGSQFAGSVAQSYFITKAVVPEQQNKWANGFEGAYGEFYSNWGSLFDGKPVGVRHPYFEWASLFPEYPEFNVNGNTVQPGQTLPGYIPQAYPNNIKDFFQTGLSATTSLSLGSSSSFGNLNFSYSHLDEKGFILNNNVKRDNFSLGGNALLSKKFTLSGSFNYANTFVETPPSGAGGGSNSYGGPSVFANLFYVPRNIDLMGWPWENPLDHSNVYYRNNNSITNPRWIVHNSRQTNLTSRFFSSSSLNYKLNDFLNFTYRLGYDTYSEDQTYYVNKGGGPGFDARLTPGAYRTTAGYSTIVDHNFMANINKRLSTDINLTGLVGYNLRSNDYTQRGLESLGQVVYGLLEHRNFTTTQARDYRGNNLNYKQSSTIMGVYFDANVDYKNMIFLNVSGRNDWSTTLQKENRSIFYPGVSLTFLPTTAFPNMASSFLEFLKLRVAYGTSANFGTPYNTTPYLSLNSQARKDVLGNVITLSSPGVLPNKDLKPELLTEFEAGVESQLVENRIKFNFSYYNRTSKDQIIQRPLDPSTGGNSTYINAGTITNKGVELSLTGTPLKTNDWNLDLTLNFTKNVSKVESLPEGSKEILVNGYTDIGNYAIEGMPLNVIKGTYTERTPDGQLIVREDGNYKVSSKTAVIGDPNPNWLGSAILSLSWKSFNLGMQWDYVSGGQVFSYTAQTMVGRGVSKDLENFEPSLPLILPGVREITDASGNVTGYKPNDIPLTTAGVFFANSIIGGDVIKDRGIYDATRVRFREISLSYTMPKSIISKLKLKGAVISLVGNNLWFRAINAPKYSRVDFDRTAFGANNGAGFDFLGGPSALRYGVNLKINF